MAHAIFLRRRNIIGAFIVLVVAQVFLIGSMGDSALNNKASTTMLRASLQSMEEQMLGMALRIQSDELLSIAEVWHNDPQDVDQFLKQTVQRAPGVDGQRRIAVYYEDGTPVMISDTARPTIEQVGLENLMQRTNVLLPHYFVTFSDDGTRIFWNKIIVPTPTTDYPRLTILLGFDESTLLHPFIAPYGTAFSMTDHVERFNDTLFWLLAGLMFCTIVCGLVIVTNLRRIEGEVTLGGRSRG